MNTRNIYFFCFLLSLLVAIASCKNKAGKKSASVEKQITTSLLLDSISLIHDLAYLSSEAMAGRESAFPGNKLAQDYILNRYDSLQLLSPDSGKIQSFPFQQTPLLSGANVTGVIKGSTWPDKYFVLSAHYDHLGIREGNIYYGADDNASGSACLLALARYFQQHPPKHSFIFASFDAEEKGLLGSAYFVQHPPVGLNEIRLNVNMDMISRNDKNEIYASGTYWYPFLRKYIDSVQSRTTVNVLYGHDNPKQGNDDWTNQSDHYSFHKVHIPFLYFGVEDHEDYHKPTDTFDKIDKDFYYRVCNMVKEVIVMLDGKEKLE